MNVLLQSLVLIFLSVWSSFGIQITPECRTKFSKDLVCINGSICGDGYWNSNFEECDDSNLINGDGCSNSCKIEYLSSCSNTYLSSSICKNSSAETEPFLEITFTSSISEVIISGTFNTTEILKPTYKKALTYTGIKYNGYGSPLINHGYFDRVGGKCDDGQVVSGFAFQRAGCNTSGNWTEGFQGDRCSLGASDETEGLQLIMICSSLKENVIDEGHWKETGIGSPLPNHAAFSKVGGICEPNSIASGIKFERKGCDLNAIWEDGILNVEKCTNDANGFSELREGLSLVLLCHNISENYELGPSHWVATGAGVRLLRHQYFDRIGKRTKSTNLKLNLKKQLGGFCDLEDEVATGFKFQTLYTNISRFWWDKELFLEYTSPTEPILDGTTGLILWVNCVKLISKNQHNKTLQLVGFHRNNNTGEQINEVINDNSTYLLNCFENNLSCGFNSTFFREKNATHFGYYLWIHSQTGSHLLKTRDYIYNGTLFLPETETSELSESKLLETTLESNTLSSSVSSFISDTKDYSSSIFDKYNPFTCGNNCVLKEDVELLVNQQWIITSGNLTLRGFELTINVYNYTAPIDIQSGCLDASNSTLNIIIPKDDDNLDVKSGIDLINYKCLTSKFMHINFKNESPCDNFDATYGKRSFTILYVSNNCFSDAQKIGYRSIMYFLYLLFVIYLK